jgi:septum formation protein
VVLGKHTDEDEAFAMLRQLSGREHRVITGFCLVASDAKTSYSEAVVTRVTFKRLTKEEIFGYVATGEPFGKAGGYGIQGIGAFLVKEISGSYTNVVGLPLCALVSALLATGALKAFPIRS